MAISQTDNGRYKTILVIKGRKYVFHYNMQGTTQANVTLQA